MGFRTLEINHAAEIHIKEGQLEIVTEDGTVLNDPPKMVHRSTDNMLCMW